MSETLVVSNVRGRHKNGEYDNLTNDGHKLSFKERKYIDLVIETGDVKKAAKEAGYTNRSLLKKRYIQDEIQFLMQKMESEKIATATEVLQYFTSVMRGEVKDQFGLDAPLSERTRAAQELAKRIIDAPKSEDTSGGTIKFVIERRKPKEIVMESNVIDVENPKEVVVDG